MTSPASAASSPNAPRRRPSAGGFTIVELLLTIAILMVVISLALMGINRARKSASMNRVRSDFQAITMALEQYKNDFKVYPMRQLNGSDMSWIPPSVLAAALVGPGDDDGHPGPGFRVIQGGKIRQPLFPVERVRFLPPQEDLPTVNKNTRGSWEIMDAFGYMGEPKHNDKDPYRRSGHIQYYPERPAVPRTPPPATPEPGTVGKILKFPQDPGVRFCETDGAVPRDTLRYVLGDLNLNGRIDAGESLTHTGPFILASPGPDGVFTDLAAAKTDAERRKLITESDDVYNISK